MTAQIKLLKELGTVMGAKESLERELKMLSKRERELMRLLKATGRDQTASIRDDRIVNIRDAIVDVMIALRNDHDIWVPPRRIITLVIEKVPGALIEEVTQQLKALARLKGSNVLHNKRRGHVSAYFYVGLDQ